jgi:hypothetical protein
MGAGWQRGDVVNEGPSIGRVLSRAFAAIGARPLATLLPALLVGAVPSHLMYEALDPVVGADDGLLGFYLLFLVACLGGLFLSTLTQGLLVPPTLGKGARALDRGSSPLLLGVSAAVAVAVTLGLSLAFAPGVLAYVMLAVAGSAAVAERRGPWSAMLRSLDLTRGARWRVLGLFVLLTAGQLAFAALVNLPAGLFYGDLEGPAWIGQALAAEGAPEGFTWVASLAQTPVFAVWAAAQTALYQELRDWKDGPRADRLAEIFS